MRRQHGATDQATAGTTASQARRLVLLLTLSYAVSFVDRALVAVAGAPIKREFGLGDAQYGALHGLAFVAMYCLCGVPFGQLADRAPRRVILAGGLVFWSAMTALCGLATSFPAFFAARVGVGLGEACLVPVAMSMLGSSISKADMPKAVAMFLVGAALGNAAALIGGGRLLAALGDDTFRAAWLVGDVGAWRVLFGLAALPGLAVGALVMLFLREPARPATATAPSGHGLRAAVRHLRAHAGAYAWLTAATACSVTLTQAQAAWMPFFFQRRFALAPGEAASTVGLVFLATAPTGMWLGGRALTAMQRLGLSAPSNLLLASTALLSLPAALAFCLADDLRTAECAYAAFNLVVFTATPAGLTGWQLLTPDRVRGVLVAVLTAVVTLIGVGLGPGAVGLMTDRVFGDPQALNLALLVLVAVAGATCAACALAGQRSFARATGAEPAIDTRPAFDAAA